MELIIKTISELKQFADVMSVQDDKWLAQFKQWFNSMLESHCRRHTLFMIDENNSVASYQNMPIDDLAQTLFNSYYAEILKSVRYRKEKLEWWDKAYKDYQKALPVYERLKKRGVLYAASHLKKLKKCSARIKVRNITLSMVDIVEIAFARYAAEAKGHFFSNATIKC